MRNRDREGRFVRKGIAGYVGSRKKSKAELKQEEEILTALFGIVFGLALAIFTFPFRMIAFVLSPKVVGNLVTIRIIATLIDLALMIPVGIGLDLIHKKLGNIVFLLFPVYASWTTFKIQGTVGQFICRIRVYEAHTMNNPSLQSSIIRSVLKILFPINLLLMLVSKRQQGLHDLASKTVVMKISKKEVSVKTSKAA